MGSKDLNDVNDNIKYHIYFIIFIYQPYHFFRVTALFWHILLCQFWKAVKVDKEISIVFDEN